MLRRPSNNPRIISLSRYLAIAAMATCAPLPAQASWLDSDFYCRVYGCVIVHDGISFDVYDIYEFSTGGTVGVGQRMIPWTGNPFQGAGGVNPVITGSRTEGFYTAPLQDQSVILGIDTNGDGIPDRLPIDANSSGFLDAGDDMGVFNLNTSTNLVAANTSAQRSFYLSSRTDFYLTAQASLTGPSDSLNTPSQLANIGFAYSVTRTGSDDGMSFGAATRRGNYIRSLGNVNDLSDIFASPTRIMEFRNAIRQRNSNSLPAQSVRFDYVYGFDNYDLSMGEGHLRYEIEFDIYNR